MNNIAPPEVPDSWFISENIRLSCIRSNERWLQNKVGAWLRKNYATTQGYNNDFSQRFVLTEHFIKRLYERSYLDINRVKRKLFAFNLKKDLIKLDGYFIVNLSKDKRVFYVAVCRIGQQGEYIFTTLLNGEDDGH